MNPRYTFVAERAGHRREYCHAPEVIFNFPFEVDHIRPPALAGDDDDANYALSCRACNLFKADRQSGKDESTGLDVKLFNPRTDRWEVHFRIERGNGEIMA